MDLVEHFRLIWHRRWLIIAVSVLVAGAVFARSRTLPKVYEAEAVVDVISGTAVEAEPLTREQVEILTDRFAVLAETTTILEDAVRRSDLDLRVSDVRSRVSTSASGSGFVTVSARGPSRAEARALSSNVVDALVAAAELQQDPLAETEQDAVQVVSEARASPDPVAPSPLRDGLLALLVALVVSAELAALLGTVAGRLPRHRLREEVEHVTASRVLARIPKRGREEVVEAFRELRAQIDFARADLDVRSLAIMGVDPDCGTSFVARGLAQVAANLKASVVLVDANLRHPTVADEMHLPPSPGLGDVLLGAPFNPVLLRQANPLQKRFRVLTGGIAVPDAPGLLGAGALRKLLDQMTDAELIVIDAPAVSQGADALVIGAQSDASLLIVDAGRTRRRALQEAVGRLEPHARLLGSVVNRVDPERRHLLRRGF